MTDIRPATVDDISGIVLLFRRFMREITTLAGAPNVDTYVEQAITVELARLDEYYLDRPGCGFWVLMENGRVTGSVGIERFGPHTAELRRMIVESGMRRSGRGKALLARAEEEALLLGYRKIVLETTALQPAAIALYERSNYTLQTEALSPPALHKGIEDLIIRYRYSKSLGAG